MRRLSELTWTVSPVVWCVCISSFSVAEALAKDLPMPAEQPGSVRGKHPSQFSTVKFMVDEFEGLMTHSFN